MSHEHADAGIGNYAGVDEQSGIYAGDGGFNINVKGNTDLKGAVIASDADASKNTLNTGTLTFSDIDNHSDYSASSSGFSAGASIGAPAKGTGTSSVGNGGGLTPMLSQSDSGSSDATTRSAISAGSINIADKDHQTQDIANLSRDTVDTNGTVSKLPDVKNLLDKQGDMMNAASAAGEAVVTQIGAIADAKRDAAKKAAEQAASDGNAELAAQYKAEAASWDEGGTYRVAMHTAGGALIAGLGGGSALGGAAGAGVASALAGKLNQMADSFETNGGAGTDPGLTAGNIAVNLIAGGIGGLVGGNSGAVTASNADLYNRNSTNAEGNGGTGSEFIDRTKSAGAGAWNGLVSIAEMGVNLPNGGPFASPGDPGYISLDSARLPYTAGDQIGPDVAFWTAVLATRGVGKGAAAEAEAGAIQFGKVDNQISHTFRHIEAAGFDREVVQTAIQSDLSGIASSLPQGQYTGSIVVNGVKLDYSAFKLPDGTINVGRITPPRTK